MAQTRHLTPVGRIVKAEDALDRKIFKAANKLTTPFATLASIGFFILLFLFIAGIIWAIVTLFTGFNGI